MSWNSGSCRAPGHGYWSASDTHVKVGADHEQTAEAAQDDTEEHEDDKR